MKLSAIIQGTGAVGATGGDRRISRVTGDSREVVPGAVFFALPGAERDGHDFVPEAVRRGAVAVVAERDVPCAPAVLLLAPSARRAMAVAAANFHGNPAAALLLAGVTGTNGKTTVAWLVEACARAAGVPVGMLGTVTHRWPGTERSAGHTTPESTTIQALLAEMRDAGARAAVLEVSSHALAQERVGGMRFRVAGFTNLTRDHLDYHGDMERYFAAKRRLFVEHLAPDGVAVVNVRDPLRRRASRTSSARGARLWRYGGRTADELRADDVVAGLSGIAATLVTPAGALSVRSPLVGAAQPREPALRGGHGARAGAAAGRGRARPLASRAARPAGSSGSPRAASRCSSTTPTPTTRSRARSRPCAALRPRRLVCVFGCGGDRDRGKRPLMGEAAGRGADLVIVTSDNPRSEDPSAIIGGDRPGARARGAAPRSTPRRSASTGAATRSSPTAARRSRSRSRRRARATWCSSRARGTRHTQIVGRERHPVLGPRRGPEGARDHMSGPRFTADELAAGHRRALDRGAARRGRGRLDRHPDTSSPGALFVALRGERFDAHDFLADAAARGAAAAVVAEAWATIPLAPAAGASGLPPHLAVADTLVALGAIARLHRLRLRDPGRRRHRLERQDHHPRDDRGDPRDARAAC